MSYHTILVLVVQDEEGFAWVEDCIDSRVAEEAPEIWQEKRELAFRMHGAGNIRVAKLVTNNGWLQALFKHPVVSAEPIDKIEDHVDIPGCAVCPFKIRGFNDYNCTHPGVEHLPVSQTGIQPGSGSPDWCPLTHTPVIVRRSS